MRSRGLDGGGGWLTESNMLRTLRTAPLARQSIRTTCGSLLRTFTSETSAPAEEQASVPLSVDSSPSDLAQRLLELRQETGTSRVMFYFDRPNQKFVASHDAFAPLADAMYTNTRDFWDHEAVFIEASPKTGYLYSAFVHNTNRGQAAGGVRHWKYDTVADFLNDGLRLATGMACKNALAGLWWGGGKGVITSTSLTSMNVSRDTVYKEYGSFVSSLNGCYVTAEDVGTNPDDMATVFSKTRFTTCIPYSFGGSGNPSGPTAKGVYASIIASLHWLDGPELNWKERAVAVQGCGQVGSRLIRHLLENGCGQVFCSDISSDAVDAVRSRLDDKTAKRLHVVDEDELHELECDVLAPCALGGVLNATTIPEIRARIVCGGANNQLLERADADLLKEKGIVYVPDFVVNRMGIVNCANEQYGRLPDDPAIERHFDEAWEHSLPNVVRAVLDVAHSDNSSTLEAALKVANMRFEEHHPVWPDRTRHVIDSLWNSDWANSSK